jgi:hypothetical protein
MSDSLTYIGIVAAIVIFLASIVNFVIRAATDDTYGFMTMVNDLVTYVT